ncbi:hypothetical protein PAPYR_11229 [Paratrimastix pyriformis]|uniref:Uncharacterized protein n=1 Tax=Paratrimastix pyriformis TaxID=342808 RepID=A0ABQ8U471_9EUKA|nr:hypothetical protein PAPYR_11229 [Paratrimastix pyriformis]
MRMPSPLAPPHQVGLQPGSHFRTKGNERRKGLVGMTDLLHATLIRTMNDVLCLLEIFMELARIIAGGAGTPSLAHPFRYLLEDTAHTSMVSTSLASSVDSSGVGLAASSMISDPGHRHRHHRRVPSETSLAAQPQKPGPHQEVNWVQPPPCSPPRDPEGPEPGRGKPWRGRHNRAARFIAAGLDAAQQWPAHPAPPPPALLSARPTWPGYQPRCRSGYQPP